MSLWGSGFFRECHPADSAAAPDPTRSLHGRETGPGAKAGTPHIRKRQHKSRREGSLRRFDLNASRWSQEWRGASGLACAADVKIVSSAKAGTPRPGLQKDPACSSTDQREICLVFPCQGSTRPPQSLAFLRRGGNCLPPSRPDPCPARGSLPRRPRPARPAPFQGTVPRKAHVSRHARSIRAGDEGVDKISLCKRKFERIS